MKHNDNAKLVCGYSLIRVFTSASKFYEYRTQNLNGVKEYLKNIPVERIFTDENCCVNLYMFFKNKGQFMKYKEDFERVVDYVPKR